MWDKKYEQELLQRKKAAQLGGGLPRIEKQHASGKMTARERIEHLFDENTFVEIDDLIESRINEFGLEKKRVAGDGVVTGYGQINGRTVFVSSEDFTVIGGTLGEYHSLKICHAMDMAYDMRVPFISINDSGGARIEEGIASLSGYSGIFLRNTRASGVIPQIAVIMGPCAGGACYSPAICDFVFMTKETSRMFITGPGVVKAVTGETVTTEDLGGATMHAQTSGVNHFVFEDDRKCLDGVRKLLSYLPDNNHQEAYEELDFRYSNRTDLREVVPDNQKKPYDVAEVVKAIVDDNSFMEVQSQFATNVVIGLARMAGRVVGIVANQPKCMSGCLDCDASDKAARFIRFCDCFNIPLVSLVDVPGFLPGTNQEQSGIIRHGAKMLFAYSEATVPKVSVILRKAYGGAYIAMNSKNMGADMVFAWPIAQIAVMGAEGAVDIVFKKAITEAEDPAVARTKKIAEYEQQFLNPYIAAKYGYVNEVIMPDQTRMRLLQALDMLKSKTVQQSDKKHGNIPL